MKVTFYHNLNWVWWIALPKKKKKPWKHF